MRTIAFGAALLLAGCASRAADISASYVSPIMYQNHTCQQLALEAQGISARAAQVAGAQEQKRTNDAIATGVAIVVFWPAAFFVSGDGPVAAELAQLKGQMNAVEQASIARNCAISFQRNTEAGAPPVVTQVQPAPASASPPKQAGRSKAKHAPPPAPAQSQTVIVAEPPEPTLSESDRAMSQRN